MLEPIEGYEKYIGKNHFAASGGDFGIFIVGALPEVADYIVMPTKNGKIDYSKEPYRIDTYKASYRYVLKE